MDLKTWILFLWLCYSCTAGDVFYDVTNNLTSVYNVTNDLQVPGPGKTESKDIETDFYQERLNNQTKILENALKKYLKTGVKNILPTLMKENGDVSISSKCTNAMMKYLSGLSTVKVWAIRMLDATAKPPSGILEGTISDFGSFDSCLEIEVPKRNGELEFRGQYCAIEATPFLPPIPKNYSMAKQTFAKPLDNIGEELKQARMAFYYLKFRYGVCIPSACSLQDMQNIAVKVRDVLRMQVEIPQCYVKEAVHFKAIHIVVIFILSLLLLACLMGSVIEYRAIEGQQESPSTPRRVLKCFSLITNFNRLMAPSSGDLKALHGLRTLTMAWVMLGHNYGWSNFDLLRSPNRIIVWFSGFEFLTITNAWLSVETFFFLSGFLTSYGVLQLMSKTKGRISVPLYMIRRYIRLTPSLLMVMGLAFFMPLISSGPFFYERVDTELRSCRENWWMSILYISNWFGMKNICVHTTWYLSADFQLHVVTIVILYVLYRSPKLGFSLICSVVILCSVAIGVMTYLRDLPPAILISSGNHAKIEETVSMIYMQTFTHAGSYYVGIVTGYLTLKYKDIRLTKVRTCFGWCCSSFLSLTSLYGMYRWTIGEPHGPLLTCIYAAVHRTLFTTGVAWVAFACATEHGDLVNRFLSSPLLLPLSRLSFLVYLLHGLVIWVRIGSLRERLYYSHYNMLYDFMGNTVVTVVLAVPLYLLLEAPLCNLEKFLFSSALTPKKDATAEKKNGHIPEIIHISKHFTPAKGEYTVPTSVQLTAVKSLGYLQNTAEANDAKLS